jgi:hypothetical protein
MQWNKLSLLLVRSTNNATRASCSATRMTLTTERGRWRETARLQCDCATAFQKMIDCLSAPVLSTHRRRPARTWEGGSEGHRGKPNIVLPFTASRSPAFYIRWHCTVKLVLPAEMFVFVEGRQWEVRQIYVEWFEVRPQATVRPAQTCTEF